MHVKVCGLTRAEDAIFAANCGADFIGLVCADSPRRVSLETARAVAADLPPAVPPVLVFRDAPLDEISAALNTTGIHWVQLHGAEPVSYVRELVQRMPPLGLIRAWEVAGGGAATELAAYLRAARAAGIEFRAVLLDAPKGQAQPGHAILGEVSRRCHGLAGEFWCAGGLTTENLADAVRYGQYAGVDVARGVERRPGIKDHAALRRFIAAARSL